MKYLFLLAFFITTPTYAEFGFDDGIRKPQSVVVAGDSVIDDMPDTKTENDTVIGESIPPSGDDIDPFSASPTVQKPTQPKKAVVKRLTPVKIQRSIADDRIDDSYVQDLVKQKFDFSNPIE